MVRTNIYLTEKQHDFLNSGIESIKASEHIRRAIDEYIQRMTAIKSSASTSSISSRQTWKTR